MDNGYTKCCVGAKMPFKARPYGEENDYYYHSFIFKVLCIERNTNTNTAMNDDAIHVCAIRAG